MARAARGDPGFRVIAQLTDRATKPIQNINNQIAQSTARLRGMMAIPGALARSAGLDKIGGAFANIGSQVGRLRSSLAGLMGPFLRLGGIIGGFSLGKLVTDAVTAGGELIKLNKTTGVSVEGLQKLQYAAVQSGLSADELGGALTKLNKSIAAGRKGKATDEIVKVFKAIGISAQELRTLNTEEVFLRASTAISNMSDPIHKADTAMKLFGKSGAQLLALLDEGGPAIAELGRELEATGAIMDRQTAAAAKEFSDIMTVVSHQIKGIAYDILKALLPAMKGSAEGMRDWFHANREWLSTRVVDTINGIVEAGRAFVNIIRNEVMPVLRSMRPAWDLLVNVIGEGNAVLLAFTSVVAPGIIAALAGIGKAVVGLGVALVANPIGAAILAIGAAVALVAYGVWKNWDEIKGAFHAGYIGVLDAMDLLWENLKSAPGKIAADFTAAMTELWEGPARLLDAAWGALPDNVQRVLQQVVAMINGMAGALWTAITGALTKPLDWVRGQWDAAVGWLTDAWDRIKGIFGGMGKAAPAGGPEAAARGAAPALGGAWAGADRPSGGELGGAWAGAGGGGAGDVGGAWAGLVPQKSEARMTVDFKNMPQGVTVQETARTGNTDLVLNVDSAGPRTWQ